MPTVGLPVFSPVRNADASPARENALVIAGLILASLPGVDFEDAARLLGVKPLRLEEILHGVQTSIPTKLQQRWLDIAEMLALLHSVLRPSATARWLNTEIPSLDGATPLMAIDRGRLVDVLAIVRVYNEPAFS
jgi:hypothetical protein